MTLCQLIFKTFDVILNFSGVVIELSGVCKLLLFKLFVSSLKLYDLLISIQKLLIKSFRGDWLTFWKLWRLAFLRMIQILMCLNLWLSLELGRRSLVLIVLVWYWMDANLAWSGR